MKSPVKWLTDDQYKEAMLPERLVAWADSQVGVREVPKGSNRGPSIKEYLARVGLGQGFAWCAAFIRWCAEEAGYTSKQLPDRRLSAGVKTWATWARTTGRNRVDAERGRLGYWLNADGTGHIFVCLGKPILGIFRTIEGNTDGESGSREGDGVYKRTRTMVGLRKKHAHGFIELEVKG